MLIAPMSPPLGGRLGMLRTTLVSGCGTTCSFAARPLRLASSRTAPATPEFDIPRADDPVSHGRFAYHRVPCGARGTGLPPARRQREHCITHPATWHCASTRPYCERVSAAHEHRAAPGRRGGYRAGSQPPPATIQATGGSPSARAPHAPIATVREPCQECERARRLSRRQMTSRNWLTTMGLVWRNDGHLSALSHTATWQMGLGKGTAGI